MSYLQACKSKECTRFTRHLNVGIHVVFVVRTSLYCVVIIKKSPLHNIFFLQKTSYNMEFHNNTTTHSNHSNGTSYTSEHYKVSSNEHQCLLSSTIKIARN